jgi:hypothetical protein
MGSPTAKWKRGDFPFRLARAEINQPGALFVG